MIEKNNSRINKVEINNKRLTYSKYILTWSAIIIALCFLYYIIRRWILITDATLTFFGSGGFLNRSNLLENETVVFTAEDGAGMFSNNNRVRKILTDDDGRAKTQFVLGKAAGERTIHISVDGGDGRGIKLLTIAKPTPPTKMIELEGNYQTGELGKRLPVPFTVAIRDRFDNPIPMFEVDFLLKKGSGRFQDTQNSHLTAHTNELGLAQVFFIVGNDRGAREIEVEAKATMS